MRVRCRAIRLIALVATRYGAVNGPSRTSNLKTALNAELLFPIFLPNYENRNILNCEMAGEGWDIHAFVSDFAKYSSQKRTPQTNASLIK
jgi:hypothetical protein